MLFPKKNSERRAAAILQSSLEGFQPFPEEYWSLGAVDKRKRELNKLLGRIDSREHLLNTDELGHR